MILKDRVIEKMKGIFGTDVRRINHALDVLKFSEEIMLGEKIDERLQKIVVYTAILHDIGILESEKKYNSTAAKYQELEGPPIAEEVLKSLDIEKGIIDRVCYIIGGHHTVSKIDGIDFQIIWEADLLVNIEGEGLKKNGTNLEPIIEKNFKTFTGKRIAKELYL